MKLKNGAKLLISKAVKEDAEKIIEYLNLIGGESDNLLFGKNGFDMSVENEKKFIDNINSSKTSALFIGKINSEIVCIGSIQSSGKERIAHQSNIAISVKKKYWNNGIGTQLTQTLVEFARNNGVTEILHLGVKYDNANAIKLYEKMGFEKIGLYKNFFKINGAYFDEVLMNLYL